MASPRSATTRERFFEAFATYPEFVPGWRPAGATWNDLGGLVAIRLRRAAEILEGGWIKYFCWGSQRHCSECTSSPSDYYACSSYVGAYHICLGDPFWQAWRNGDVATMASTLLHEALHIYFSQTVAHEGSTGNANCYERFVMQLNALYMHPDTAAGCPINLHLGSRGLPVRELQRRLNAWIATAPRGGLARLSIDGDFGSNTDRAVRAFQTAMGLTADGVVGAKTWNRLPRAPGPNLQFGSRGPDVLELQYKVNTWLGTVPGGTRLNLDGIFGSSTQAAVRAFQAANGLAADGIVGSQSWRHLPPF
ncbi:MAG: peptidoglycan-binding protein [candidate division KSB1 bacterium]|nr:peptidoglycan-binding protein [candidate division KSB1 bacterium]MDZ7404471.1 peptidoglycan-binding protein [candidate division KSB1 bacterium]